MIRLQRTGKKKQASFRIVLQEKTWKPNGKAIELLGFYNPHKKEKQLNEERIKFWIAKGAKPSPTVHNILIDSKVIEGDKIKAWRPKRKSAEKQTEAPTEAAPAGGEATPKVEAKEEAPKGPAEETKPAEATTENKEVSSEKPKEEVLGEKEEKIKSPEPTEKEPVSPGAIQGGKEKTKAEAPTQ